MAFCSIGDRSDRVTTDRKKRVKYEVVAVDFFTKWVEAEPLASIMTKKVPDFVVKNIIFRFGLPAKIVSDNGTQFDSDVFRDFCTRHGIQKSFSAVDHPQANRQVEAVNKTLKDTLKKRLEQAKSAWPDELPEVLWSYRTSYRTATGYTPFSLYYGYKAMFPVELDPPSHIRLTYVQPRNEQLLLETLDTTEEQREKAQLRVTAYQQKIARYFNSRVRERKCMIGDLLLRRVFMNPAAGVL